MAVIPRSSKAKIDPLVKKYQNDPILPLELAKIIPRLRNEDASVKDFVNFYQRDPLLCAYLIDLAWQATSTRDNHPSAADHAMSTIGITGARQLLVNIAEDESSKISKEVIFLLTSSILAGELAKNLCKDSIKKQNLYWAAIAHQFPDIILWHVQPKAMWKIQYQQAKKVNGIEKIDQQELGFTRSEWRQQIALTYHMSELNQSTYNKPVPNFARQLVNYAKQGYSNKTPALKDWNKTDSWHILTANWLAKSLIAPWLQNSHQHYFYLAKQAFDLTDKQIKQAITLSIRNSSDYLYNSSLLVPASCCIFLPQKAVYPKWLNQPDKPTVKAPALAPVASAHDLKKTINGASQNSTRPNLKQLLDRLLNNPQSFSNSAKLLTEAFNAITLGLGFSRVVFMTVDWNKKLVSSKLAILHPELTSATKIRPDFEFSKATPLQKFLQGKGFLVFDALKHNKIWSKMPLGVRQQRVKQFVLFSVVPQQRVKAIIYVDGQQKIMQSEIKIKQLKILLNAINKALAGQTSAKTA